MFDGVYMGATIELNGVRLTATAATTRPPLGNVSGATDQFLRYAFPVSHLLRPATHGNTTAAKAGSHGSTNANTNANANNVLTVTFGVAENESPGTSNGRFTFSTSIDWAPVMLTTTRQGRATFGFGLWKSVYLLPVSFDFESVARSTANDAMHPPLLSHRAADSIAPLQRAARCR